MREKLNLLLPVMLLLFLVASTGVYSQSRAIGAPELQDFAACASDFNMFTAIAELSPGAALPDNNQFILQLSDPSGSFDNEDNILELDRINGPNNGTSSNQDLVFENFAVPETVNSDTYRMRIIASEVPGIISDVSQETAMHFFRGDLDRPRLNGGNSDVIFCNVTSFVKTLIVTLNDSNDIDVSGNYIWEWSKDGVVIDGVTGNIFETSQIGKYRARVPLGDCQLFFPFAATNNVDISIVNVDEVSITTDAADFSYCPDEIKELKSSIDDLSFVYQWTKNGVIVEGETRSTITLPDNDFGGEYVLTVIFSEDCTVSSPPVTVTNEGSSLTQTLQEQLILLPRQTLNLTVTTDAPLGSPLRWIVATSVQLEEPLSEPTSVFEATFIGDYRVEIDAQDPCNTMLFSETEIFAAVDFDITIAFEEEDISCNQPTLNAVVSQMSGITSGGLEIPITEEQLSFFTFEWFRNGTPTGVTDRTIQVTQSEEAASYELRADLITGEFTGIVSNLLALESCDGPTPPIPPVATTDIIPNIVLPGGSNTNAKTWRLPSTLAKQQDVEVAIYTSFGQQDIKTANYQNDWPSDDRIGQGVYYYVISRNNQIIKKGSITVMR